MAGAITKLATHIDGLDEITRGGLPVGRVTLVSGTAGAGKTALAMEVLYRGAAQGQPAVFVAFEETPEQLKTNGASFGWFDDGAPIAFVHAEMADTILRDGDFDLNGLLAVVGAKLDELGAGHVVFDGLDVLLAQLADSRASKREIARIRRWVVERELVGVITAKHDAYDSAMEALGVLQFAVDAVIELRHERAEGGSYRTLRVSKYRGSDHSTDEFGCTMSPSGLMVQTRGHRELEYVSSDERVGTGVAELDDLVGGGYFRGTAVLLSGAPGTAKTTFGGAFIDAACERGERALFVSFDESAGQICRNLRSVGIDLQTHVDSGLLRMSSQRTRSANLERHILRVLRLLDEHEARSLVIDPISAFQALGRRHGAGDAAVNLIDHCKARGVTIVSTSLVNDPNEQTMKPPIGLSSIADVWIHLANSVHAGERNRTLSVVKARGTAHTNQVRELLLGDDGIELAEVYTAGGDVLLGTLRWEREERARKETAQRQRERARLHDEAEREMLDLQRQMMTMEEAREALRAKMERLESAWRDAEDSERTFQEELRQIRRGARAAEGAES